MTVRTAIRRSVSPGELPDFTPVPRKCPRHDGWTPERQRAFIRALADTGCVKIAARMVNMAHASAYELRRQPGAESFRAAWDAAQALGLQVVKDEAFDRAMNGEQIPVFVAGKLMGFRRKKNDRLLMFILRHYGQDAQGRKTTINYFSTRASAGAASSEQGAGAGVQAGAQASTTTVRTTVSGPDRSTTSIGSLDDEAANILNAFAGVDLDAEAQDQIYRALAACAERRRALEDDPENDPERFFIGEAETNGYLGELESGVEGDWVEYRPEGEHRWENLGEGGEAEKIDKVLAEMAERRAKLTPEEIEAEKAQAAAAIRAETAKQQRLPPPDLSPDDPRLDWRNWSDAGYVEPSIPSAHPEPALSPDEGLVEGPTSPRREHRPRKAYKKRTPKPPFTPPDETRKARVIAEVEAERNEAAAAEAKRRERRQKPASLS